MTFRPADVTDRLPESLRGPIGRWLLVTVFLVALPVVFNPIVAGHVVAMAIFAIGYNVLLGYGGQMSFGHAAYFAIGAYGTALALTFLVSNLFLGVLLGVLLAMAAAAVFGRISLFRRGVYFAMITLAFGQMVYYVIFQWNGVTGGSNGMPIPLVDASLGGIDLLDGGLPFYVFLLVVLAGVWVGVTRFLNSPFGRVLVAVRENEERAIHLGYHTDYVLVTAFAVSGLFSGLGGALYALLFQFISPSIAFWTLSGQIVLITVLGGVGTRIGPLLGAAFFIIVSNQLTEMTTHWELAFGALFVIVVLFAPQGIYGLYEEAVHGEASGVDMRRYLLGLIDR